ncbi:MAG TPA: hypothetical protein VJ487_21545 [Alphaproteobacteria bacterium]|nr:hypothetical protein [Alphaproteobacteria bacterium]
MPKKALHAPPSPLAAAPAPWHQAWREAGKEPGLREVLADPLVHLVMRRDGVTLSQLEAVLARAKERRSLCCLSAA